MACGIYVSMFTVGYFMCNMLLAGHALAEVCIYADIVELPVMYC